MALLLTAIAWCGLAWPLPLDLARGIPASARHEGPQTRRYLVPGDHLQLLYHFQLVAGFLRGDPPLFYNLYEFNTGDDEARYLPGKYYAPFSLVFGALAPLTGAALAWNLLGLLALWLTLWFTWLLVRRLAPEPWIAWPTALVALLLPYRWITLAGGSPTGLAMLYPPLVLLGVDVMVADRKPWGGVLAGLAIYFAGWTDDHTFFFCALAAPAWALVAYLRTSPTWWPSRAAWRAYLRAALPFLGLVLLIAWLAWWLQRGVAATEMGRGGRALHEIRLFSLPWIEAVSFWHWGRAGELYLGWLPPLLVLLGGWVIWARARRTGGVRQAWAYTLLLIGLGALVVLASGPRGLLGDRGWRWLTRLVPPYGLIRQPAKIYVLAPTLLAVALAWTGQVLWDRGRAPWRWKRLFAVGAVLLLALDVGGRLKTLVCLLDERQGAYEAIVAEAAKANEPPRMLALPLWPGNAHWTSLNQYFAALYGIRMVNGYKPTVPAGYRDEIFEPFERFNKGCLPAERLDDLLARGVRYLVLHEDAFPEKVSPFGVSQTLAALLKHPRLRLLAQDRAAWAFVIGEPGQAPAARAAFQPDWALAAPTRFWQLEHDLPPHAEVLADPTADGGRFVRLATPGAVVRSGTHPMCAAGPLAFALRSRNREPAIISIEHAGEQVATVTLPPAAEWRWTSIAVPPGTPYGPLGLRCEAPTGGLDLDVAALVRPPWEAPAPGAVWQVPAPVFFHAGYTDPATGEVVLEPERAPADIVFYGPRYPLRPGRYVVTVAYTSPAPAGTTVGQFEWRGPAGERLSAPLVAGDTCEFILERATDLPLTLNLRYFANAELRLRGVTFSPLAL